MKLSITNNLKEKLMKLVCIVSFLLVLYVFLELVKSSLTFKESYANRRSVDGFPETWSQISGSIDGVKYIDNGNEVNAWIFDSSDYVGQATAGDVNQYNYDISANVNINRREFKYFSYTDRDKTLENTNYIILKKTVNLQPDIRYRISTMVNIGDDTLSSENHYVVVNGKRTKTILPEVSPDTSGFYKVEEDFLATASSMTIELISEMSSKGTKEKPIIWKEIQLTYAECDTTKCAFSPCASVSNPDGFTGNNRDGMLDLPSKVVDNVSYYYKFINYECKGDATDCYDNSTCGSCLPGKVLFDKNSFTKVGYVEPGDDIKKSLPDCVQRYSTSTDGTTGTTSASTTTTASTGSSSVIGTTVDAIGNVGSGGIQTLGGAASILGGIVQSLGGGIYAVYDYETGKANVVNGAGTTVAGAENIVNGLTDAGRIPTNALFGAVGVDLVSGNMEEKAEISSQETASSDTVAAPIPVPYESSIQF